MAEDVGEVGVEVAVDADLGERDVRPVGALQDLADRVAATGDYVFRDAFEEDFADELGVGELGAR